MSLHYTAYTKDGDASTIEERRRRQQEIAASSALVASSQVDPTAVSRLIHEVENTRIGKLKFVAKKRIAPVDIETYSSLRSFDGWCYPDGRLYNPAYFPQLASLFPSGRLPDLRRFFKPYTAASGADLSEVPYSNQLPAHRHQITVTSSNPSTVRDSAFMWITGFEKGHTEFGGKYYDGTEIRSTIALHGSDVPSPSQARLQPMSVRIPAGSSSMSGTTEAAGEGGEAYPAYNDMPVMMFIGFPAL